MRRVGLGLIGVLLLLSLPRAPSIAQSSQATGSQRLQIVDDLVPTEVCSHYRSRTSSGVAPCAHQRPFTEASLNIPQFDAFGLTLGASFEEIQRIVTIKGPDADSHFNNAFDIEKFPTEYPELTFNLRTIYFTEGRLWRVFAQSNYEIRVDFDSPDRIDTTAANTLFFLFDTLKAKYKLTNHPTVRSDGKRHCEPGVLGAELSDLIRDISDFRTRLIHEIACGGGSLDWVFDVGNGDTSIHLGMDGSIPRYNYSLRIYVVVESESINASSDVKKSPL